MTWEKNDESDTNKLTRFGVSVDSGLLKRFDRAISSENYSNRSEAIRDLIREKLVTTDCGKPDEEVAGTFTMLYNHDQPGLVNQLINIQHHCKAKVSATTHIHLDDHFCVEVLIIHGKTKDVKKLGDSIRSMKGVSYGKLVLAKIV